MTEIVKVVGRQIFDSRGNPTVEADAVLADGSTGSAAVPSGASTGEKEAVELRDGDKSKYGGKGVTKAVDNINNSIRTAVTGLDASDQRAVDAAAYSDEMGHRFRCKWGSAEPSDAGYSHHRRSAPIQSRCLYFGEDNRHHFVSIISFLSGYRSGASGALIPIHVGRRSDGNGAAFRNWWGTRSERNGAVRPIAPPSISEHFRRRCFCGTSMRRRDGMRHL